MYSTSFKRILCPTCELGYF